MNCIYQIQNEKLPMGEIDPASWTARNENQEAEN